MPKQCAGSCGRQLPLSAFSNRSGSKDGHMRVCKRCNRASLARGWATRRARARRPVGGQSPKIRRANEALKAAAATVKGSAGVMDGLRSALREMHKKGIRIVGMEFREGKMLVTYEKTEEVKL